MILYLHDSETSSQSDLLNTDRVARCVVGEARMRGKSRLTDR